jgi:hypothetical protein
MLLMGVLPAQTLARAVPETFQIWLNIDFERGEKKFRAEFSTRQKQTGRICRADGNSCRVPGSYCHLRRAPCSRNAKKKGAARVHRSL